MGYSGTASITEAPCLSRGRSSGGGADELKMGCLVSSSSQRGLGVRVIQGSAVWHEGTQIIPGMFSLSPLAKAPRLLKTADVGFNFYLL